MKRSIERLLTIDRSTLSRDKLLDHLAALHTLASRVSAEIERDLAAVSDPADDKCLDREEIACLLRWSSGFTQARIVQAHKLVDHLPTTLTALGAGTIAPEHARAVAESCYGLTPALCAKVEKQTLEKAGTQTVTELKRSLTRAVKAVDPRGYAERHAVAKRQRDVCMSLQPNGMASIWSMHTHADADAIMAALQRMADRGRGDRRLVGERRADALRDLILGTMTPLPPVKPVTHRPISFAARFRYEPCAALKALIVKRDKTCRFPGCNRKAVNCEIDHVVPYNGYNTIEPNLHALCSRHHHCKHEGGWKVRRLDDGSTEWTSPTGRRYVKPPPEPEPPP